MSVHEDEIRGLSSLAKAPEPTCVLSEVMTVNIHESGSPEEQSLRYALQQKPLTLSTDASNAGPAVKLYAVTAHTAHEKRKNNGQIKGGGIKQDGCADRCGKVVSGRRASHVVVIRMRR